MELNKIYKYFNQDYSCISIGDEKGYSIYQVSPFEKRVKRGK
jgi:hypothetical protein